MTRPRPSHLAKLLRLLRGRSWRQAVLPFLSSWNRNQITRLAAATVVVWAAGTLGLHLAERGGDRAFDTLGESFWNVWVILFSGVNAPPGRAVAMLLVMSGSPWPACSRRPSRRAWSSAI